MEFTANDTTAISFEEFSLPYIGRWTRLISTTNWDKGLIIHQWRQSLIAADAPATEFSDEVWSSRVGGVSPQHVGRLRRVYDRFGDIREQFPGLFWSHYQAVLDWDDAEMWLEGATQNDWSVAQMRKQRSEALGESTEPTMNDETDAGGDWDEDAASSEKAEQLSPDLVANSVDRLQEPQSPAGPDFGDEDDDVDRVSAATGERDDDPLDDAAVDTLRPFENLPDLPEDLQDAFEAFKICIVKYKTEQWHSVPMGSVLHALDALKQFAASK